MNHNRKGFTLTELMLTVAIIGVVGALGAGILIQVTRFIQLTQTRIDLQREARAIFSIINRNLRQATTSSIQIDQLSGQPYYSRIRFTRVDGKTFTFYQQNQKLIMQTTGGNQTLSENLRYLVFACPKSEDLSIISVSMTLEKSIYEKGKKALHMASEKVMVMNE